MIYRCHYYRIVGYFRKESFSNISQGVFPSKIISMKVLANQFYDVIKDYVFDHVLKANILARD